MYFVEDRSGAIILMVLSLLCLGSWPVFFNILERRGRLPQHTYLDYSFSTFITAAAFALTLGEIGYSPQNFTIQIMQVSKNGYSVIFAMLGGVTLCLGNIMMQYSLAFVGISLTEVVSASIAVVIGTTVNYFLDRGLNQADLLFPGVACFLIAVVLGSFCHASNATDINIKLGYSLQIGSKEESSSGYDDLLISSAKLVKTISGSDVDEEPRSRIFPKKRNYSVGSAEYLHHVEKNRAIKIRDTSVAFGLSVALLTGLCYAFFSPLVNIATNDQFHLLQQGADRLSVYSTFFYFSLAFLVVAVAFNVYLLYHPILGLPKSSISCYMKDNRGRILAILAGLVCGVGNGFQFMGGEAAGYAAADAVQALPLVGTFWAILLFGEYHNSSGKTYALLAGMLSMFLIAISLLIASARQRTV